MLCKMFELVNYASVLLFFLISVCLLYLRWRKPSDLPPGPSCFPPIGNIRTAANKTLVTAFREWRKEYGDIYTVGLGAKWVVVINGYETFKEAFVDRGDVFSDRPDLFVNRFINEKRGIIGSDGETWKQLKRFTLGALRNFGFGKSSLEKKIVEEVNVFLEYIYKTKEKNFYIDEKVNVSISNIICSIAFGERYDYEDEKFVKLIRMLDEYISNSKLTTMVNFIPLLRFVPGDFFSVKKVLSNQRDIETFIQDRIDEHKITFENRRNIGDFVDAAIHEMNTRKKDGSLITEVQTRKIIRDLFIAGTQTTVTTIKWFILFQILYPEVQEKMWREIDDHIGSHRFPSTADRQSMPYCEAVIQETLRIGNITPLSVLHGTNSDIFFKGYRIPKGSVIVPNLDSVLMDETTFPEPERFYPERFIGKDGKLHGLEKNIAFSIGRRACLGESLARMELFLFCTSLVQRFKFLPPYGTEPPEVKRILGLQYSPAPFMLRAVNRQ